MEPDQTESSPLEPVAEIPAPKPPREPFWDYVDLVLVLGLVVLGLVVISIIAGLVVASDLHLQSDLTPLILPTNIAAYAVIYFALKLVLGSRYGRPVFRSLGWRPGNINLLAVALGGVVLAIALSLLGTALRTPKVKSPFENLGATPLSFGFLAFMAVVLAPIFEELFFRGFLQPLLSRTLGAAAGIVITAALFGGMHAPEYSWAWQYAFCVALAGIVFGYLRYRTKSLIPCTVMHGCFNAVSVIALAVAKWK
ncbi:MAG TPA: type II CAAX endopeptidase family protein [Bryobacteraceae bacterium]|nr:type II CAAX endopeptidase family protein [Bryobacteraceae bacterium]